MNKFFLVSLLLALSLACQHTTTALKTNVRSGPGTTSSCKVVKAVDKGTVVCVLSVDKNGWAKLDDGTYILSTYLQKVPTTTTTTTTAKASTTPTTTPTTTTTTSSSTNTGAGWTGTKRTGPKVKDNYVGTCRGPNIIAGKEQNFINKILLGAQQAEWEDRVLTSITLAQAILESGWGKSPICNNLFGVKSYSTSEPRCLTNTKEVINGKTISTALYFRKYDDWGASVKDHTKVLLNARYAKAIGNRDYKAACEAVQAGGYATATAYAKELIGVIESYGLWQYDLCCNYEKDPSCTPKVEQSFVYKDPSGKCGVNVGSCKYLSPKHCCSYWKSCGTSNDFCGTGKTQCVCDCPDNKTPCCKSNSYEKC